MALALTWPALLHWQLCSALPCWPLLADAAAHQQAPAAWRDPGSLCRMHCLGGSHTTVGAVKSFQLFWLSCIGLELRWREWREDHLWALSAALGEHDSKLFPNLCIYRHYSIWHWMGQVPVLIPLFAVALFSRLCTLWSSRRVSTGFVCVCMHSSPGKAIMQTVPAHPLLLYKSPGLTLASLRLSLLSVLSVCDCHTEIFNQHSEADMCSYRFALLPSPGHHLPQHSKDCTAHTMLQFHMMLEAGIEICFCLALLSLMRKGKVVFSLMLREGQHTLAQAGNDAISRVWRKWSTAHLSYTCSWKNVSTLPKAKQHCFPSLFPWASPLQAQEDVTDCGPCHGNVLHLRRSPNSI